MGDLSDGHWHRLLRLDSLSVVLCSGPAWVLEDISKDLILPRPSAGIWVRFGKFVTGLSSGQSLRRALRRLVKAYRS